ncbi:MAG TPA: glycine cleavage system protein GcvH [Steroidobacteraceae bacterium]|jgi:glycine cleavage system H protein
MSKIPADLRYTRSHEWLKELPEGIIEIGISDHAQESLGDLVFVEMPEVGRSLAAGEACAVVESVKAASDIYAPVAATVVAINAQLAEAPELINQDPYGRGWIMRLKPTTQGADAGLLSALDYQALAAQS